MINLDPIIIEFVTKNYLALTLFFMILKGIAKMTPWAWDDSLASLLVGTFKAIKKNGKNGGKNGSSIDHNGPAGEPIGT